MCQAALEGLLGTGFRENQALILIRTYSTALFRFRFLVISALKIVCQAKISALKLIHTAFPEPWSPPIALCTLNPASDSIVQIVH
jgi:hypothetical protein